MINTYAYFKDKLKVGDRVIFQFPSYLLDSPENQKRHDARILSVDEEGLSVASGIWHASVLWNELGTLELLSPVQPAPSSEPVETKITIAEAEKELSEALGKPVRIMEK